eukprot:UN01896
MLSQQIDMVCLLILHLGFPSLDDFPWLDRPTDSNLNHAIAQLLRLKAFQKTNGIVKITGLGKSMARFPLQPHLSKALVIAKEYNCSEWTCSLVAMLSSGAHGIFVRPKQFAREADRMKET